MELRTLDGSSQCRGDIFCGHRMAALGIETVNRPPRRMPQFVLPFGVPESPGE